MQNPRRKTEEEVFLTYPNQPEPQETNKSGPSSYFGSPISVRNATTKPQRLDCGFIYSLQSNNVHRGKISEIPNKKKISLEVRL